MDKYDPEMKKIQQLSKAITFIGISFLLMVLSYVIVYTFEKQSPLLYIVVPFVLMFWASSIYLTWLAYGKFMSFICIFTLLFPPAIFLIMLLSYSRATVFIKSKGLKLGFSGAIRQA